MASVLVVEDERILAKELVSALGKLGYDVAGTATSGEDAIRIAEECTPDLVLMDIKVRGEMDGVQAADYIRGRLDVPIVYLSAYAEHDVLERAKGTHPYGIVGKPVSIPELKSTLEIALCRHRADIHIKQSEVRHRFLFRHSPVALWEEDFSGVRDYVRQLQQSGVRDIRAYLAENPEEIWTCVEKVKILDVNDAAVALYRATSREELLGSLAKVVNEDSIPALVDTIHAIAEGRTDCSTEGVVRSLHDETIHILLQWTVAPGFEDTYAKTLVSVTDITPRKRAEQALAESEERFRGVFENAAVGIDIVDLDCNYTGANAAFCEMVGYSPDEIRHHTFLDLTHPDDRPSSQQKYDALLSGDIDSYRIEKRLVRKDGSYAWVDLYVCPIRNSAGAHVATMGIVSDITERKYTEERLRKSEEKYRALFEGSSDGVLLVTERGDISDANQRAAEIFGYTIQELKAKNLLDLADPEDFNRTPYKLSLVAAGRPQILERLVRRKDGSRIFVEVSARKIGDNLLQSIYRDITERKETERRIKASLDEKEVLLREIHHRVKNNLAVVHALLSIQSRAGADEFHREMFENAKKRIRSMAMAHELLYQSDPVSEIRVEDYLGKLIDHLAGYFKDLGGRITINRNIESFVFGLDVAVPLGLIVTELVSNALKHGFPDGRDGEVTTALRSIDNTNVELTVFDNGVGFPAGAEEDAPRSLGLGLVDIFVRQLRGTMAMEHENGTRVWIRFPKPS